jgi:HPt (histidine-containing phosphotransfer) domain-containing protein
MEDIEAQDEKEIMAKPALNPDAPAQLGYPKELCINLIDNFFKNQLNDYIKNINSVVESDDQFNMYSAAHKLVGASFYAGVMRVGTIADKMQKYVPRDGVNPNFKRYKDLHKLLLRETQVAFDEYERLKNPGGNSGRKGNPSVCVPQPSNL